MPLQVKGTNIPGVRLLRSPMFADERGSFCESYNKGSFDAFLGDTSVEFVQDNHTVSRKGVLRGLHYQTEKVQGKLIRVLQGEIFDVVVDLRRKSPAFGTWHGFWLSASERWQLWVPPGLAHGFLTLSHEAEVVYKVTNFWNPDFEATLRWDDKYLRINWPLSNEAAPIVSAKDARGLNWEDAPKFE